MRAPDLWLHHFQRILPSVAPHLQTVAGLHFCRAWLALGQPERARQALTHILTLIAELPPLEKIRTLTLWADIAQQAAWTAYALQALQQATRMLLHLPSPFAIGQLAPDLARAWLRFGQTQPLHALVPALANLAPEDPSAAVDLALALLEAAITQGDAALLQMLVDTITAQEGVLGTYLLPKAERLAQPEARPALQALTEHVRAQTPTPQTIAALAAAVRWWARSGQSEPAQRLLAQAEAWAGEQPEGLPRAESLAHVLWAASYVNGGPDPARFREVAGMARAIGYMDDRARVLQPLLAALDRWPRPDMLEVLWPALEEIGYPRFFAPLVRAFIEVARRLQAAHLAQQALDTALAWLRQEGHHWKRVVLVEGLAPVLTPQEGLPEVTQQVLGMPASWQGRGLAALAEPWARHGAWDQMERLFQHALDLAEERPRQQALEALLRAWGRREPQAALQRLQQHVQVFTYPHVLGQLVADLLEWARPTSGEEVEP